MLLKLILSDITDTILYDPSSILNSKLSYIDEYKKKIVTSFKNSGTSKIIPIVVRIFISALWLLVHLLIRSYFTTFLLFVDLFADNVTSSIYVFINIFKIPADSNHLLHWNCLGIFPFLQPPHLVRYLSVLTTIWRRYQHWWDDQPR